MNISWLFEIDTNRWSTKTVTFLAVDYTAKIYPESFGGISMGWDITGGGLVFPSDLEFEIDNSDAGLTRVDLEGEYCTIKLITDDSLTRTWKFKIKSAILSYGKVRVYCSGIMQDYLDGDYPNTPHPRETWVSAQHEPEDGQYDDYRIPVIFGTAYIPLMYIYHTVDATGYYVLGDDVAYTINEVKSPPESGKIVWDSGSYTFNQSSDSGYKLAEFVIATTETPSVYTEGTWPSGQKPLVKYSKTSGSTSLPATILSDILQDFGIPAGDIDTGGSFVTAAALYSSQGIVWNGGFYEIQNRESVLSDLLIQCDSTLYVSDKIELHQFSKTSKETFDTTKTKKLSYHPSWVTKPTSDSGHVAWADEDFAQNNLVGKALVPIDSTTADPDSSTFECKFIRDDVVAQKLGILHFQRKLAVKDSISFSTVGAVMSTLATLKPSDVVTIDDTFLGGSQDIIISDLHILPDLEVRISGRSYSILQEFDDLSVSAIPVTEDPVIPLLGLPDAVYISGDSVFKFLADSATPVTSPVTLTANLIGDLTTYDWEYWTGSAWANLSGTQDEKTYSMAYDNAAWGSDTTLLIRCLSGTVSAEMTMAKIYDGDAGASGVDAGNWSSTLVLSSTDYNTVAWASGNIITAGTTYSIVAGNTGNMAAGFTYYLYLKPSVSTTVLQTTPTAANAVGPDQILVGVAFPNTDTGVQAQFQAFGGRGGIFINADNIAAGSITADKIVANSLTSTQIVTSNLVAYSEVSGTKPPTNADQTTVTNINSSLTSNTLAFSSAGKITFGSSSNSILGNATSVTLRNSTNSWLIMDSTTGATLYSSKKLAITTISTAAIDITSVSGAIKIQSTGSFASLTGATSAAIVSGSHAVTCTASGITITSTGAGDDITLTATDDVRVIAGDDFDVDAANNIILDAGSAYEIQFQFGGTEKSFINTSGIFPTTTASSSSGQYLGFTSFRFYEIYGYRVYDAGGQLNDTFYDLYEISQFTARKEVIIDPISGEKTKGESIIDPDTGSEYLDLHSVPRRITNYNKLLAELVAGEYGLSFGPQMLMTEAEIIEDLEDYDELGWMISRDIGASEALTNGGLREKLLEDTEINELIFSRLTALENANKGIVPAPFVDEDPFGKNTLTEKEL